MGNVKCLGNKHMQILNGDDHLSPFELGLWELTYHCLLKFGCPVMFHSWGPNAPARIDQKICFFVPEGHPMAMQVVEFLQEELDHNIRKGEEVPEWDNEYMFGCNVEVKLFRGFIGHLERHQVEGMAENFMKHLMDKISKREQKPN